jgi:alkyl hydroperoxide reductase subunit AhpF
MLDVNIKTQLKAYLEKLQRPIELVASLDDSAKAQEMRACSSTSLNSHPKSACAKMATRRCALPLLSACLASPRASALPACRWATSSPH